MYKTTDKFEVYILWFSYSFPIVHSLHCSDHTRLYYAFFAWADQRETGLQLKCISIKRGTNKL